MDHSEENPSNTGVVVGAGVTAAALAIAVSAIGRRRQQRQAKHWLTRSGEAVNQRLESTIGQVSDAAQRLAENQAPVAEAVKAQRDRLTSTMRKQSRVARREMPNWAFGREPGKQIQQRVDNAGRRARNFANRGSEKGSEMAGAVKDRFGRVSDQSASVKATAQTVASHAAAAAISSAERARETGGSLADSVKVVGASLTESAREKLPHATQQVSQRVTEDVVPSLKDVAVQAAAAAIEAWQATRDKAMVAAETAQHDLAPQAAHVVEAAGEKVRDATSVVGEKAGVVGDRARSASRRAAEVTVDTSKHTGATLFWAGAAAGLVYYALLNEERREQLTQTAQMVVSQVHELVKDFQGYDEEF